MSERVYEVVETITITGVGYVRARSVAEAIESAKRGRVEFDWDQGQNVRRGDGIKAWLLRGDRAAYCDPGPTPDDPSPPTRVGGQ